MYYRDNKKLPYFKPSQQVIKKFGLVQVNKELFDDLVKVVNTPTEEELKEISNQNIQNQIFTLESQLVRPQRELLSTKTDQKTKDFAQSKIDDIELQIVELRKQLQ